jgi:hypothetical protein
MVPADAVHSGRRRLHAPKMLPRPRPGELDAERVHRRQLVRQDSHHLGSIPKLAEPMSASPESLRRTRR